MQSFRLVCSNKLKIEEVLVFLSPSAVEWGVKKHVEAFNNVRPSNLPDAQSAHRSRRENGKNG